MCTIPLDLQRKFEQAVGRQICAAGSPATPQKHRLKSHKQTAAPAKGKKENPPRQRA
jgi:hypothetical protein